MVWILLELRRLSVVSSLRIFKRPAKAPIRLRLCAGWSEDLLVAHITLLEISSRGSNFNVIYNVKQLRNMQACSYASNASICPSIRPSVHPSVCLSVCPSVRLSISLSFQLTRRARKLYTSARIYEWKFGKGEWKLSFASPTGRVDFFGFEIIFKGKK